MNQQFLIFLPLELGQKRLKTAESEFYEKTLVYDLNRKCIVAGVKVQGNGDYLPRYAGNLDIINNAAIYVAEQLTL